MSLVEHFARNSPFPCIVPDAARPAARAEENTQLDGRGPQSQLIACSGEFHERAAAPYSIEVVCQRRGAVLAD